MKKLTAAMLSAVMVASSLPTCHADTEKREKLLLLGDSIAYGYGIQSDNAKYGNIIANDYNFELINDAIVGDATADLLKHIKKDASMQDDIKKSGTIVISIGGNDFLGLRNSPSFTDIAEILSKGKKSSLLTNMLKSLKKNLSAIHTELRKLNPKAKIVLQTVYNPFQGRSDSFTKMLCDIVELIRKDYTKYYFDEVKDDEDMVIADVESVFRKYYTSKDYNGIEIVQSDYIHPTEQGHKMIAAVIEPAIDTVHRARWTTLTRTSASLTRLAKQIIDKNKEGTIQ